MHHPCSLNKYNTKNNCDTDLLKRLLNLVRTSTCRHWYDISFSRFHLSQQNIFYIFLHYNIGYKSKKQNNVKLDNFYWFFFQLFEKDETPQIIWHFEISKKWKTKRDNFKINTENGMYMLSQYSRKMESPLVKSDCEKSHAPYIKSTLLSIYQKI